MDPWTEALLARALVLTCARSLTRAAEHADKGEVPGIAQSLRDAVAFLESIDADLASALEGRDRG